MQFLVRPRQSGKTFEIVDWVRQGKATDSYPFHSRVIVTPNIAQADLIRRTYPLLDYREVFSLSEWKNARLGAQPVEVGIDNVDLILHEMLGWPSQISLVTATGEVV